MEATTRRSESIAELAKALSTAQGKLRNPPKDSINPHFKSKYADLATVRDAVMPTLSACGLSVVQLPCEVGTDPALMTLLLHTSGEWIETVMRLRPQQQTPQGIGSALTYARRYALQAIAGVAADDDDDGNAASQPAKQQPQPQTAKPASGVNPLVSNILTQLRNAKSRADGQEPYRQYAEGMDQGTFTVEEEKLIRDEFERFGKRFPKQPSAAS